MGTSLKDIVYDFGGGIPNGKQLKAVHFGGPMGGSIPASLIDNPLDFDVLTKLGASLGAGDMLILDEDICMVDLAKFFLEFLSGESCGKCVPCREGIRQMLKILTNITTGKGKEGDNRASGGFSRGGQRSSSLLVGQECRKTVIEHVKVL